MKKLFYQIFFKLFFVTFIPVFIANFYYYETGKKNIKKNIENLLLTNLKYEESVVKNIFSQINYSIDNLKKYIAINPNEADIAVKTVYYTDKIFLKILLLDKNFHIVNGISKFEPVKLNKIFNEKLKSGSEISKKYNEYILKIMIKTDKLRLLSSRFEYLYFEISLKYIFQKFIEKKLKDISYFVLDDKRKLVFHSNYNFVLAGRKYKLGKDNGFVSCVCNIFNPIKNTTERYIVFLKYLPENSLYIGAEIPYCKAYYGINNLKKGIIAESILLLLLLSIITFIIAKSISSPIKRLQEISNEISRGDFYADFKGFPNNEIGVLAENLKTMSHAIEHNLEAIVKEKEKLNQLFNTIQDGIYVVDSEYNLTMINDKELSYLNVSREDILGKKCFKVLAESDDKCKNCFIDKNRIHRQQFVKLSEIGFRKNCAREIVNINFIPFGKQEHLIYLHDVTKLMNAYRKTEEEKETLRVTLHSIGDGVIVTDEKSNVTLMNKVAEALTGWSEREVIGKKVDRIFNVVDERTGKELLSPVREAINSKNIVNLSNNALLIGKNGSKKNIEDSAAPIFSAKNELIGVVLVFRDVTDKRRTEKEIVKMEKLQTVGQLAGGIAHDFNNILTGLYGNISLARMFLNNKEKLENVLEKAESSINRAKDLTKQLLTFSKGGAPVKELTSIENCIRESVDFALTGSNIKVIYDFKKHIQTVEIDHGQIFQVFQNLAINAKQAMQQGGEIYITVNNITVDERNEQNFLFPGDYIEIIFKDTGEGIDKDILPKIFEPFFTTKKKGSGLGLATCFSIIQKHGGHITVDSQKGEGTVFKIYLPSSHKEKKDKKVKNDNIEKIIDKKLNVLLMDDNREICELSKEIFSVLNCNIDIVNNGEEAVAKYKETFQRNKKYDIVVLDLTVPGGMGGKDAAKYILETDYEACIVVSSGYSNDPVIANHKKYGFKYVLSKPYTISQVEKMIKELLQNQC